MITQTITEKSMGQSKEVKQNWKEDIFDISLCEGFTCYDQCLIYGRDTERYYPFSTNIDLFIKFPSFVGS